MTTNFLVTGTPDSDDDFFPDVDNLLSDMAGEDVDPKSSAPVADTVPYVFLLFLLVVLPQFLVLVFALDMLGSTSYMQLAILSGLDMFSHGSYMNMLFTFSLSNRMACFITAILVMLYLVFLLIKSFGKLFIFPTIQKPYYRQFTPSGFAASIRPPMFEGIHYKRWRVRTVLWFQTMSSYDALSANLKESMMLKRNKLFRKWILCLRLLS